MSIIRIDHDIPFSEYNRDYLFCWIDRLPNIYTAKSIWIRESCGGNTHVKIEFSGYIHPLQEMMIRAVLHDDCRRIRGDLERILLDSPAFGLLFDIKYDSETDTTLKAGKWRRIK